MSLIRFYLNKLTGKPSVFDFSLLGETVRLGIAAPREIRRAKEIGTETELVELMRRTLSAGDTIFDIGANIGLISLLMAKHDNGLDSTVHCFEPEPRNFRQLTQNIEHNQLLGRLHAHQLALGAENGSVDLHIRGTEGEGRHSIATDKGATDAITVTLQTMASFAEEHKVSPDVIKIDVEGAEGQVLAGMEPLIETGAPTHIFLEIHPKGEGEFMPDGTTTIESWLTDRGYRLAWKNKRGSGEHCHFTLAPIDVKEASSGEDASVTQELSGTHT